MKNIYKISCTVLLCLLSATGIFAQWQTNGPFGGPVYSSVTASGKIFIGTDNGVFASADDGATWTAANSGMERVSVIALVTDGINLYAGGGADGVFFSPDNGASWQVRNTGLSSLFVTSLFVSSNGIYCGTANGEFYSADNGLTWMPRNTGIPAGYSIYSHIETGDTIYAGSYITGLFRTTDDGAHWSHISGNGFPDSTFVYAMCKDGNTMYAATGDGVYKSPDRGVSWSPSNNGIPSNAWITALAIEPGLLFAGSPADGVFTSADNGTTWTPVNTGIAEIPHVTDTAHIYPEVKSISISTPNVIVSTLDGIYISTNNGFSWTASNSGITGIDITGIATAGSSVLIGSAKNGVFVSSDNGMTWSRNNAGITSPYINSIIASNGMLYVSAGYQHVFRSGDGGTSWVAASSGITSEVTELKADSSRVLALTNGAPAAPLGLFETADSGSVWTEIPTGFTELMSTVSAAGTNVYVGTWDGSIYYSNNNGLAWSNIGSTLPDIRINSILIAGTMLFIGTEGSGIYKSTDNGSTWNTMNTGLANLYINDLQLKDGVIYAATWGGGIFVSNDAGASWTGYNSGLSDLYTRKICTDAPATLYAATDAGAYAAPLAVLAVEGYELADVSISPNPATDQLHITLPSSEKVIITLYTLSGSVVYSYEGSAASRYDIDLSGRAKGVYLLDLQTAEGTAKKKIVIQ